MTASNDEIVVVEDDADIRDSVVEILRDEGYAVRGFSNGADALRHLRSHGAPSVILLDLMMPVMDGETFGVELRKTTALASVPIILLSAADDTRERALGMNLADGLTKPVRLDELLTAVRRVGPKLR